MGHRFSKTAANNIAAAKTTTNKTTEQLQTFSTTTATTKVIPIPNCNPELQQYSGPTINLQTQENPNIITSTGTNCSDSGAAAASNKNLTTAAGILQTSQQIQPPYTTNSIISSSLTSINNLSYSGRQIIIKIQLAKMENGNEIATTTTTTTQTSLLATEHLRDTSLENFTTDCNLNSTEISLSSSTSSSSSLTTIAATTTAAVVSGAQFLNLTLNSSNSRNSIGNCMSMPNSITPTTGLTSLSSSTLSSSTSVLCGATGSSNQNKNYFISSSNSGVSNNDTVISCSVMTPSSRAERPEGLNSLQFNDEIFEQNIGEIVEYCEVLEQQQPSSTTTPNTNSTVIPNTNSTVQMISISEEVENNAVNACCRRKSKSLSVNGNGNSTTSSSSNNNNNTGTKAKSRCRKCSCRDAFRRFLDPSLSRSSSNKAGKQQQQKEQKRNKSQDRHSTKNNTSNPLVNNSSDSVHSNVANINNSTAATPNTTTSAIVMPSVATNQVSLWAPATTTNGNDVLIPLATPAAPPQFVVVQCAIVNASNPLPPTTSISNSSPATNNNLVSIVPDISPTTSSAVSNEFQISSNCALNSSVNTPIVHSQVDFVHYLVPDLERITNSSFYWGKMDRYEAERLLEGKPEGTFLLRDSAQEEFLFSVTFRKYGRSLHARIEQSGHRFSFDCHDPCVFTAPTVTGLLEHYKDPACVMFFEPMLTIPLHRKNCFSLQKLCRATIVSNTTYDGINELELPARLKAYLKEYHYKQKLRVKFHEPTYAMHCK